MQSRIFSAPAGEPSRAETEDGFVIAVNPREARRQFQVSLVLMAVMAAGLIALAAIHGVPQSSQLAQQPVAAKVAVQQPTFVRSITATRAPTHEERRENWAPRS